MAKAMILTSRSVFPLKRMNRSSLLVNVQLRGRTNSREVFDSVCWPDPEAEALARWTNCPRDSIFGSVRLTSVDALARTSDIRF